jgi:hypothetical protein
VLLLPLLPSTVTMLMLLLLLLLARLLLWYLRTPSSSLAASCSCWLAALNSGHISSAIGSPEAGSTTLARAAVV